MTNIMEPLYRLQMELVNQGIMNAKVLVELEPGPWAQFLVHAKHWRLYEPADPPQYALAQKDAPTPWTTGDTGQDMQSPYEKVPLPEKGYVDFSCERVVITVRPLAPLKGFK